MNASRRSFLTTLVAGGTALGLQGMAAPLAAGEIRWLSWSEGLAKATAEHKAMGLLIYADWCPHCRELQPLFRDPTVVHASQPLVMIRQNADEAAPWLHERFGAYGTYVPRLFFLHPDGALAADIQSGNPKFPYFYQPQQGQAMRAAMTRAATLGAKR